MDILSKLPERLKEMMIERNLNTSDLAALLGVKPSTVSRYLNCISLPAFQQFVKLLGLFDCSADFLIGLTEDSPESAVYKQVPPFSERFRSLLKEYGMSQYALHKKTGFSYDNFNKWLKGKSSPYVDNLVRLAQAFDCSVDYLIGHTL